MTAREKAKMVRSGEGLAGRRSRREYTRAEVAAAKRLGLAHGKEKHDRLGGPIFWAGGPFYIEDAEQKAADYKLVAAAMKREWSKEGAE